MQEKVSEKEQKDSMRWKTGVSNNGAETEKSQRRQREEHSP